MSEIPPERPTAAAKLHRSRFIEGLERLSDSARTRGPGRYGDGLERRVDAIRKLWRGSFAHRT